MTIEVKVPVLPESVEDATIAAWHLQPGDSVRRGVPTIPDVVESRMARANPARVVLGEQVERVRPDPLEDPIGHDGRIDPRVDAGADRMRVRRFRLNDGRQNASHRR